jgi:hypothetical protein
MTADINRLGLHWQHDSSTVSCTSRKHRTSQNKGQPRLHISIDGQPLQALIGAAGLDISADVFLLVHDVNWYTRNSWTASTYPGQQQNLVLLSCACGEIECGNFYAESQCHQQGAQAWVYWRFRNSSGPSVDSDLPVLCFEVNEYRKEVNSAMTLLAALAKQEKA